MKKMVNEYARLLNQNEIKYQTVFSARFDKQDADGQVLKEIELYIRLNNIKSLTQSDNDITDVWSQLEQQNQNQESEDGGRSFDKNISMTIYYCKTSELNGSF